jgi:hypothetical protein
MRNPFRTENAAFHFLLLTVAGFGLVAIASVAGGPAAGLVVWAAVSAVAVGIYARGRRETPSPAVVAHVGPPDERRILVVAPTVASSLHRLANDVDQAQEQAHERAAAVAEALDAPHVRATAVAGEDAVVAVDDALRTFGGDEIVVLPGDDSLVGRLRERYSLPVTQAGAQLDA